MNCGFEYSENIDRADIVIFDTCSVRQKAEDKITGSLKDIPADKKIWITGCMIQHGMKNDGKGNLKRGNFGGVSNLKNEAFHELDCFASSQWQTLRINEAFNPMWSNLKKTYDNLELMFRIDDTGFLPLILKEIWYKIEKYDSEMVNEYEKIIPTGNTSMNEHTSSAFVPISAGCNQFCAYCIVPFARGLERNFEVEQILNEVKMHLQNGAKEISLLWQIVNKHPNFVEILKEILKLEGLEWLRYTSPYPTFYNADLLKLHETEPKLCSHIHIPFQSGSESILKKMFRWYWKDECYEFIDKIRNLNRDISITTDMIIWFPWESEEDFEESMKLVEYGRFDMIYMGIYSTRPWTFAHKQFKDDIPYKVKHQRRSRMNELLKKISRENNKKEIWLTRAMMVNKIDEDWIIYGYSDNMKQIKTLDIWLKTLDCGLGDIIEVKIVGWGEFKLEGEI